MAEVHSRKRRKLTPREREVVRALMEGQNNQQLAASLGISLETVKRHLSSIFDKTGMGSRGELMVMLHARERAADRERIAYLEAEVAQLAKAKEHAQQVEREAAEWWRRLAEALPQVSFPERPRGSEV